MTSSAAVKAGFQPNLYILTNLTNMHVGSGKNSYGIIDNLIQRDVLSSLPTIQSSSLKGALREFFSYSFGDRKDDRIKYIFGSDAKEDREKPQAGNYVFMSANLLSLPVRSNVQAFFRATCPLIINQFLEELKALGVTIPEEEVLRQFMALIDGKDALHFENFSTEVILEELDIIASKSEFAQLSRLFDLFGEKLVLLSDEKFMELVQDENLPIIARNYLENGVSQNLWYEQILPRQCHFSFLVLSPLPDDNSLGDFSTTLTSNTFQIGANASIGYGLCKAKSHSLS